MIAPELAESPAAAPFSPPAREKEFSIGPWPASALAVVLLSLVGVVIRFLVARQSLFADELSTYWISATHSLGGVMSLMYGTAKIPHAEITPPLYFVASWFTTQFGHSPELLRLPSLIAGTLTLPVVYLLGLRTVGRPAALVATAFTALSPFMIYYSAEARSYAVMMLLVTSSTLAMLLAIDTRRARWWVLYAVCSCGAIYTHYTSGFVLFAQFVWIVWAHPDLRRAVVLANVGVIAGLLPWASGLINDFHSPTTQILSALSPFTFDYIRLSIEHWSIGFPYVEVRGLGGLPGTPALILLALAALVTAAGIAAPGQRKALKVWVTELDRRILLVFGLALAAPVGEALVSAVSTHIFGVRNLAVSWPGLALSVAVLLWVVAGPRLRVAAAVLAVAGFAFGASRLLTTHYQRTDFQGVADFIDAHARPGDVVIDGTGVLSPGPLTGLDIVLSRHIPVFRAGSPQERDHPFGAYDRFVSIPTAVQQATATANGARVFVVRYTGEPNAKPIIFPFPARYHVVQTRKYPQFVGITLDVYAVTAAARK
jgi:4-amino-4-deoxy-L-arabinose transferase-like glycosyltransferase